MHQRSWERIVATELCCLYLELDLARRDGLECAALRARVADLEAAIYQPPAVPEVIPVLQAGRARFTAPA